MKYIALRVELDGMSQEVPVVFPKQFVHADIAAAMNSVPGLENATVVSAGECRVNARCSGHSSTLNVSSRGDTDSTLINVNDYCHGFTD